ncbi:hypothetical protein OH799_18760 [Nocardia sp. NBC_00881]|uniref:hypothetical protein n=1 Tax=Nocardia sp. NBC_00881 TaxID=2975995 RepID=UPI00386BA582|nr:hypothetical protein OH799_18760 [Nocardia sp. NBC_00881]
MNIPHEQSLLPKRDPFTGPPIELAPSSTYKRDAATLAKVIAGLASLNPPKPA